MTQLQSLETDPAAVKRYFADCERYRLSGVSHPFFRDWPLSCPSRFLTPKALHHWHRFFWDHELWWCIEALGAGELDFRFSVLPLVTGLHHFSHGVTKLKQVTERTQRDAQQYIVVVLSSFPDTNVIAAIRALMDFHYLVQAPVISSVTHDRIAVVLAEFHQHKQAILDHGLRCGLQTNAPLEHFNIPKLEMMHNVVLSVSNVGSILQWTANTTEHAHIEVIKNPTAMTNNMNYNAQICCTLDRDENLSQQYKDMENGGDADQELDADAGDGINDGMDDDDNLAGELWSESPHCQTTNLFAVAQRLLEAAPAFHLNRKPSIRRVSIDDAAQKFNIPDLRGAFGDYLNLSPLRRPQTSLCSPLASVRNIVTVWKECTPALGKAKSSTESSVSPIIKPDSVFGLCRRALQVKRGQQHASENTGDGHNPPTTPQSVNSNIIPPPFDMAELGAYAQDSREPLHKGDLWYLNVHSGPPYCWQRCEALLYPHMLLLSWIAPAGGRGGITLDLLNCMEVRSVPSPSHPSVKEDVGTIAARTQIAEGSCPPLMELLCPFQLLYSDGVERLAAKSARQRTRWVGAIWDALDRSVTLPSRSELGSPTGSIGTIRTMTMTTSASGSGSSSASTVFVPPLHTIPSLLDLHTFSDSSSTSSLSRAPSFPPHAYYGRQSCVQPILHLSW
ncbi:hypothetical protein L210DRAFT_3654221 [Boletus edulis BED1]|uniref:DUF6830 domain-containing protein n=1 Tax=Boletus edulis BED1 TaxID=1328754 RepID=A0AAD4G6S3_BOLED|nr:hypothetical protein L210DRAFT_3654221 [Boletus edulis BED1]